MEQILQLSSIVPDPKQPRKFFDAAKISTLKDSITSHGILNAITVEDNGDGTYILVDGERRWTAATQLGLTEIRANVLPKGNETERKIRQFNLQEQHEPWTPVEKAVAISQLSEQLGIEVLQTCKLLNLTPAEANRYASFASLVNKEAWVKNEMPLDWASQMRSLTKAAKNITQTTLEKTWTLTDSKNLEARVIEMTQSGLIDKRNDLQKLNDTFSAEPTSIRRFLDEANVTPVQLFSETNARGAYEIRQTMYSVRYIIQHGENFLKTPNIALTDDQIRDMKHAKEVLNSLIALKED